MPGGRFSSLAGDIVSRVADRQQKRTQAPIRDLTLIVRPPGRPQEIRVFADAERAEAELYATEKGATVEPLES